MPQFVITSKGERCLLYCTCSLVHCEEWPAGKKRYGGRCLIVKPSVPLCILDHVTHAYLGLPELHLLLCQDYAPCFVLFFLRFHLQIQRQSSQRLDLSNFFPH